MVVTDYNEQFLDKRGTDHLIDELKAYADGIASGSVDLSNYVTKEELQAKLDALDINIDLSSYATKEELTNAINSIDLSAYALKTEIPSLDGYATTEYVDNAIANAPSGGGGNVDLSNYYTKAETNALIPSLEGYATEEYVSTAINSIPATDLSNYYTKSETYSKTEVDIKVAEAGGSSVPILSMEDWIELNTQYDENINFCNKMIYFDTSIAFKDLLKDKTYRLFLYDENGKSMKHHNYVMYENGVLKFTHSNKTNNSVSTKTSYLYDKTQSNGEWSSGSLYGNWVNGWQTLSEDIIKNNNVNNVCLWGNVLQLGNGISSPNFSYEDMEIDAYDIDGKELYYALLKSIIKIVDENGNEITFKTVPTKEDYLEYVNNLSGGGTVDLSNYYTKDETYSKNETYNKTEVNTLIANSGGGGGGSSSGGITYAFDTEIATGETWVDGKPIYMKVLDFTNVTPTSSSGYNLYMTTYKDWLINEVIDSRIALRNGASNYTTENPYQGTIAITQNTTTIIKNINSYIITRGIYHNVITSADQTTIQVFIGTYYNNASKKIYLTVKYTKP